MIAPGNFLIRVDASTSIGTGHVVRCLTLANALAKKGADVSFICREHEGHLCDRIQEQGFAVHRLPAPADGFRAGATPFHAVWLGAPWQEDAEQTGAAIRTLGVKPDWLVVDHYALDHRWEHALRPLVGRIFAIDDLADRIHDCDLLLDQNLVADIYTRYIGKVPADCSLLLGPEYALLQPIYAELHDRIPPREGPIRRILISFGGADSENLTGRALSAFLSLNRPDIDVDVVISDNSPYASEIRDQVAGHANIHLHGNLPTLAPLMAKADLAIGAAGTTSWERLCLGLPALVVTLAENQRPIADGLHRQGLVRWLGHKDEVTEQNIRQALAGLIEVGIDEEWSLRCKSSVDGKGVDRIGAVLTITADTPLLVRHARLSDEALLLDWANDPETRQNSFSPDPISAETHRRWFHSLLRDLDGCRLYVVETKEGIPVGQVRFERHDQAWEISYSLAPQFRKRGMGRPLLEAALLKLRSERLGVLVLGKVKSDDPPSCKVFESLDFSARSDGGGMRISVCSDTDSWSNTYIPEVLLDWLTDGHEVTWTHDADTLPEGDICFFLSYGRIVSADLLKRHGNNLVVHASDLPMGRGWSPLTWQILEGKNQIPVTLFEAAEAVDSGPIYKQVILRFSGLELIDELRHTMMRATIALCRSFVREYPAVITTGTPQQGEPTFYARRRPKDSFIDVDKLVREQFNLLRVVDNERYPAWFEFKGKRFILRIEQRDEACLPEIQKNKRCT